MRYFLIPAFLSVAFAIFGAEKKEATETPPEPAKKVDSKSTWTVLKEKSGKAYRKIRRETVKALDFTGSRAVSAAITASRNDRIMKAYASGQFMAKNFAGKKVALLLFGPLDSEENKVYTEAFAKVTDGKIQLITISVETDKGSLPLPDDEPTVTALNDAFLKSIAKGADALVNLAGLPGRNSQCRKLFFWQWSNNDPRVYLADSPDPLLLKTKLFPCPLAAVAVPRLLTEDESEMAADFNARYIELTEKNLKSSGLFPGIK